MPDSEKRPNYQVADLFRERCLINDRSLLWPDDLAWSLENLNRFWSAFVEHPDESKESFVAKWSNQLREESDEVHRIAVDLAALYSLFPSNNAMGPASKAKLVSDVSEAFSLTDPDPATRAILSEAFNEGLGSPGQHYLTGRPYHMAFFLGFARRLKSNHINPMDADACLAIAEETAHEVKSDFGHSPRLSRNMILNLLFPQSFEPIASDDHKERIRGAFGRRFSIPRTDAVDSDIRDIRRRLEQQSPGFSGFYDGHIRPLWDMPVEGQSNDMQPAMKDISEQEAGNDLVSVEVLSPVTHLDADYLNDVYELLSSKRQLIFEGPPGSGKTFVAEKFARWFTGQPVDDTTPLDKHVEIVQFHQSYGYEDFVQGIRPETNDDGQLVYRVRDGIFLDMVARARANPGDRFVLIIDEINRGNLSRIFGELLLLLEYRNQSVRLPYGSGDAAYLSIPDNLYIIGTMNTADRSLAQIDYALRRRFYFVRFMPVENGRAGVFEQWLEKHVAVLEDRERLASLFRNLNDGIRQHLATDDMQVGHSYFMQEGIETKVVFDRVWKRAVRPLLEEYVHHHRNREQILEALDPDTLMRVRIEEEDMVLAITPDEE